MSRSFFPRLSQATDLLPVIRAHLVAAASRHQLPEGFSVDLLPIVDDGIFGYELLPQRETHTYLTMGCDNGGKPVLRKCLYCAEAPSALRLATVNGRVLTPGELEAWHRIQPRDFPCPDWASAAQAVWREFATLFPEGPRRPIEIHDARHRCLDDALAMACSLLAAWDPRVDFCGVPDEAQYGIALSNGPGESGQMMARTQGRWTLRREAAGQVRHEHGATTDSEDENGLAWACAGTPLGDASFPPSPRVPADSGAAPRHR